MKKSKVPAVKQEAEKGKVGLTINWIGSGESKTYACGGFHLAQEDQQYLPRTMKDAGILKLRPGDVVYFPAEVAEKYRSNEFLRVL